MMNNYLSENPNINGNRMDIQTGSLSENNRLVFHQLENKRNDTFTKKTGTQGSNNSDYVDVFQTENVRLLKVFFV